MEKMSKEELIDKLLKITKELIIVTDMSYEEIKKNYIQTKIMLEAYKDLEKKEENNNDTN